MGQNRHTMDLDVQSVPAAPRWRRAGKSWLTFALRWGIAIVGIGWVVSGLHIRDRVTILDERNHPVQVALAEAAPENFRSVRIIGPGNGQVREVERGDLVNARGTKKPRVVQTIDGPRSVLAFDLSDDLRRARRLLVEDPQTGRGRWTTPQQVMGRWEIGVPHPLVETGLASMVQRADPWLLLAAVMVFPLTFLITSYRWHELMKALGIRLGAARAFVLNVVGMFYSTFMLGSTGGDVLKAYYAAQHTPLRTRAVMSVLVDRVIGLLGLIVLGGTMAAVQWRIPACRQVAMVCGAILAGVAGSLAVFYIQPLRRLTGLDFLLGRLPMQRQVRKAVETMEIYRRRPWLVLGALVITLPVHATVVVSATFAGSALNLPLHPLYYWVAVPVMVLASAIPISPQGAGVMEAFAVVLTRGQGCTVSQAFALAMCVRLTQILWNLTGGIFVFRGGYHAPSAAQREALEAEGGENPAEAAPVYKSESCTLC